MSESYLSSLVDVLQPGPAALRWECLNQQGIPESQLLSPAGMMCEMCGFLRLWLLFFFLCLSSSALLVKAWLSDGRWSRGEKKILSSELAAVCLPPTPSPVFFLSCFLWD